MVVSTIRGQRISLGEKLATKVLFPLGSCNPPAKGGLCGNDISFHCWFFVLLCRGLISYLYRWRNVIYFRSWTWRRGIFFLFFFFFKITNKSSRGVRATVWNEAYSHSMKRQRPTKYHLPAVSLPHLVYTASSYITLWMHKKDRKLKDFSRGFVVGGENHV